MTTLSLHVVDLAAVNQAWEGKSLDALISAAPRGRVACLLSGPVGGVVVDGRRPAAQAVPAAQRRDMFEAMVEDLAVASIHDVPEDGLNAVLAVIARVSGKHDLALDRLRKRSSPASPVLTDADGRSCAVWSVDTPVLEAARAVVDDASLRDADLPEARVAGVDKSHIHDVLDALGPIFVALSTPGVSLVAADSR
jgi:hypothetical protein